MAAANYLCSFWAKIMASAFAVPWAWAPCPTTWLWKLKLYLKCIYSSHDSTKQLVYYPRYRPARFTRISDLPGTCKRKYSPPGEYDRRSRAFAAAYQNA